MWHDYFNLLEKYQGDLKLAGQAEIDRCSADCPRSAEAQLEIAYIYYHRVHRKKKPSAVS